MRRAFLLAPLVAAAAVLWPVPAEAVAYAASGAACTIKGTSGDDVLDGTSGRDVICGLGGEDVLRGGGGNDVLDGGPGSDVISGGAGSDKIYGGTGADELSGNAGNDTVAGGWGNDTLTGGTGGDLILGQQGNDDLNGQAGADTLDGGAGTNWCTVGSTDSQNACVYDRKAPTISYVDFSPAKVDVTNADRALAVRVRVKDDTGVVDVQFFSSTPGVDEGGPRAYGGDLVSGTVRDGIWEFDAAARRWIEPGKYTLSVSAVDRVGRRGHGDSAGTLTVANRLPDRDLPLVKSFTMSTHSLDVRTKPGSVTVTARITDDASGVTDHLTSLCAFHLSGDGEWFNDFCPPMELVKGTPRDGYWRATLTVPKGSIGGDWTIGINAGDRRHGGSRSYVGEAMYRSDVARWGESTALMLKGDARLTVKGRGDAIAAKLTELRADVTEVDTLTAPQTVNLYVRAVDAAGEGVTYVNGGLTPLDDTGDGAPDFGEGVGVRYQGSDVDGWWRITFTLPQGTPPGRYAVSLGVLDRAHWRSYATPHAPGAGESYTSALPDGKIRTTALQPWDGIITVVANPAG